MCSTLIAFLFAKTVKILGNMSRLVVKSSDSFPAVSGSNPLPMFEAKYADGGKAYGNMARRANALYDDYVGALLSPSGACYSVSGNRGGSLTMPAKASYNRW
jgi:hypothetical protein